MRLINADALKDAFEYMTEMECGAYGITAMCLN